MGAVIEALRRLLWLVPLLVLGAVGLFAALSASPRVRAKQSLPTFYNPHPVSAQSEAERALQGILHGADAMDTRLTRLGGAALPHLLPQLAALGVRDRRQVSLALSKLRERIEDESQEQVLRAETTFHGTEGTDRELLHWERFYQDHDLDFRPINVARLARRLAERPLSLREGDLLVLDTYALPYLVAQLGRIRSAADVDRLRRLVPAISRASGLPYEVSPDASIEQARYLATRIRRDWDRLGPQWTQLDRFETLAARLSQTEFAIWLFRTRRVVAGLDTPLVLEDLLARRGVSVLLLLFATLGALLVGPGAATFLQLLTMKDGSFRRRSAEARTALAIALCLLIPGTLLHAPHSKALCALQALVVSGVSATYLLHKELTDRLDWRSHHVLLSRPPLRRVVAMARWLAPSIPTLAPIFIAELFLWITCVETTSGLGGLGQATVAAYLQGELETIMAVCLGLGLLTAALQLVGDAVLGSARWQRGES